MVGRLESTIKFLLGFVCLQVRLLLVSGSVLSWNNMAQNNCHFIGQDQVWKQKHLILQYLTPFMEPRWWGSAGHVRVSQVFFGRSWSGSCGRKHGLFAVPKTLGDAMVFVDGSISEMDEDFQANPTTLVMDTIRKRNKRLNNYWCW